MSETKLARMANDIANFFAAYPRDEAVTGIHDHIRAFWTPKMRAQLADLAAAGGAELHPLVIAAATGSGQGVSPAKRETAGPGEAGEIGASDAG